MMEKISQSEREKNEEIQRLHAVRGVLNNNNNTKKGKLERSKLAWERFNLKKKMSLKKRYKKRHKGRDEKKEEVSSYWLALRNGECTGI
jgi:predicted acetyltransferase